MPHFSFDIGDDGTVRRTLRDGKPYQNAVKLEQVYSLVTIYFQMANQNLDNMGAATSNDQKRRLGLQSFLMSLTGIEAFINTYFHVKAIDIGNEAMIDLISKPYGSLTRKLSKLIDMTPDGPLRDQDTLVERLLGFYQLRNEIVHPKWVPSALTVEGEVPLIIGGLVENRHALFEDETMCSEAMYWCLLIVARVGEAAGYQQLGGFLFHWTGHYGLTLSKILERLELSVEP